MGLKKIALAAMVAGAAVSLGTVAGALPANFPDKPISFLAMAAPGSGFDQTTRAVAACLDKEGLIKVGMPVTNTQSSSIGAQTAATRHVNDPYMLSFNSLSLMMRYATGSTEYTHKDFSPIARLTSDYYTVVVRADSPIKDLKQFLDELRANPKAFPLAGGQSDDRVFYGMLFSQTGIDPAQVNYIPFSGGGEATALLLEGSAGAQISTLSDVAGLLKSGEVRALAISSAKRLEGEMSKFPTLKEQGVDLEWQNFRYAMGGPKLPEDVVKFWQGKLTEMVKTDCWKETLQRHQWGDEFLIEGFDAYLDEKQQQIIEITKKIGIGKR
jgi:putative tricarboxylic transport membrane protein